MATAPQVDLQELATRALEFYDTSPEWERVLERLKSGDKEAERLFQQYMDDEIDEAQFWSYFQGVLP